MNEAQNSILQLQLLPPSRSGGNSIKLGNLDDLIRWQRGKELDKYSELEEAYTQAVNICEQQFGADHLYTAQNLNTPPLLHTHRQWFHPGGLTARPP